MAHWAGTRSGWNARGGTVKERLETAKTMSLENNPDSVTWQVRAEGRMEMLLEKIGKADYELWMELTFPGETIDDRTWKEIYEIVDTYHPEDLECSCNPARDIACNVCQAASRLHNSIEDLF